MIRSLKVLAPFSLIANVVTIGGLIVIMQYLVRSRLSFNEIPLITSASEWPVFFASAMYVFEGIALVSRKKQTKNTSTSNVVLRGFANSTKNERTRILWRFIRNFEHWHFHRHCSLLSRRIFWLSSIWFRCSWIDHVEFAQR